MAAATSSVGNQGKSFEVVKHVLILFVLASAFFPLYMMFNISTKTNTQFYDNPWTPTLTAGEKDIGQAEIITRNYVKGWGNVGWTIPNTIYLCVVTTAVRLAVAVLAAYAFARYKFPGSGLAWGAFMLLMLMPAVANLVPLFILLRTLGLLNTYTALVLTGVSGGQVFNIYILKNYIEDTPETLFEAAEIDGAGPFRQVWNVVVPMNSSIIATLACLSFIEVWNNFLLPLIIIRDPSRLPIAVSLFRLEGAYVREWGSTMAAYGIAAIPLIILFVFTMRFFIRGVAAGAVKG